MKEKYKKAVYSVIYRCVICALLFVAAFIIRRFFPEQWEYAQGLLRHNADFNKAAFHMKEFFKEILPI